MNTQKAAQTGYNLVELMIVVVIIGILASIVVPGYTDYVKRGKAAEATANLADLKNRMEQCFQDNKDYTHATCAAICATPTDAKYFAYSCGTPAATTNTFTLSADAVSGQGIDGFSFTVDQDGVKTSNFDGTTGNCWLTKKGGTC